MRKSWTVVALLALVGGAAAQEEKKSGGEQKVAFEKKAFPFEGEVTVERLNVRLFPKADQASIIAAVLTAGDKVSVVGEKEDYYQVLPTRGCTAWIFGRNVKRDGATGVVSSAEAPVRMDSRLGAEVLCSLKEGDSVKVVSEHMGWLKIEAPAAVKYFVGKKYIRVGRELDAAVAPGGARPAAGGDAEARARIREAEAILSEQQRKIDARQLDGVDFAGVVSAFEAAAAMAKSEIVKSEAQRGLRKYESLHAVWEKIREEIRIRDEERAKIILKEKASEPERTHAAYGYIDTTGSSLYMRPGTHKLVVGGKIVCFLKAKDGDDKMIGTFNDFFGKYVAVDGVVVKNPAGWDGYSVIVVSEVVAIDQPQQ
jgi:uncharacterized protein YgiM (DUF1202 family)